MHNHNRRAFLGIGLVGGLTLALRPRSADAGVIEGTFGIWCVRCGQIDEVSGLTRSHDCSRCHLETVIDGRGQVVCPVGHHEEVSAGTSQHVCSACGRQCRRNAGTNIGVSTTIPTDRMLGGGHGRM